MASEVREDYLEALEDLTACSRPTIQILTEIAQENEEFAGAVVDAVSTHTERCAPAYKLPAMYLVDSLLKAGGPVYVSLIEPRIVEMFTVAFGASPEPVRMKLSDLFKTWTIPGPNTGAPRFSHHTLSKLNDYMISQSPQGPLPPQNAQGPPKRLTQSSLLVEMHRLRKLLEEDFQDKFNEVQLSLLARFESEISGVVDPKTLPQLQAQLEDMRVQREQYLLHPPPNKRRSITKRPRRQGGSSANSVPLGRKRRSGHQEETNEANEIPKTHAEPAKVFDLATACSTDASDAQIDALYSARPLQCATCGFRFPNTEAGREAKQAEMDWHFRANKDIREGHSRNRCWFLTHDQWVHLSEDEDGQGNESTTEEVAFDPEAERKRYIDVPIASSSVCPICQEPHETSWSEEAENWVWMNAVEVNGFYFHATCYADPQNKETVKEILA